jgi:hypothetical protein
LSDALVAGGSLVFVSPCVRAALVVFTPALPSGLGSLILSSRLLRIDGRVLLPECARAIVAARCVLGVFAPG